ncbi:MAG: ABC-2 family transporter protein [Lachnospiraceae bacterium]|nr:ABC-2 family transporter protein [Lachnospiraceae bacterium]MCR5267560.1 ABC-2 family transporter protein [Lachnospiraceae bacterium]
MNFRKYTSLLRAGIMESLHFRMSALVLFFGNLVYIAIIFYLWKAIYASSPSDVVNGMTFTDTLIYVVLASSLFSFMEMYFVWEIGRSIQSGKIVLELIKPMGYRHYLFWSYSGSLVTNFFSVFLPTFIVIEIVTKGAVVIGLNLVFFVAAVIMGVVINYNIDLFVGTICLYTESIWGINIMKQVIVLLFSGATIPLAFFPQKMQEIAYRLPFQSIYNTPLRILLMQTVDLHEVAGMLLLQLFWCVVLTIFTSLFWRVSIRQITVNGG